MEKPPAFENPPRRAPVEIRVLSTPEATRSALDTLATGSDSVRIAAAFIRHSGIEELQLLHKPPSGSYSSSQGRISA